MRAKYVLADGFLDTEKSLAMHRYIPADSPAETMAAVERGVRDGRFQLLDIFEDGQPIGFTVYHICECDAGPEMLSICTYARGRGDVTIDAMPLLEGVARQKGCKTIRLHTMRPGLVEKLKTHCDWFVSEIVLRKELDK
jgi:hypothetical protein